MDGGSPKNDQQPGNLIRVRGKSAILGYATYQGGCAGAAVGAAMMLVGMVVTAEWKPGYVVAVVLGSIFGAFIGTCAGFVVGLGLLLVGPDASQGVERVTAGVLAMASSACVWLSLTTSFWRPFGWWALTGIGASAVIAAWRVPSIVGFKTG